MLHQERSVLKSVTWPWALMNHLYAALLLLFNLSLSSVFCVVEVRGCRLQPTLCCSTINAVKSQRVSPWHAESERWWEVPQHSTRCSLYSIRLLTFNHGGDHFRIERGAILVRWNYLGCSSETSHLQNCKKKERKKNKCDVEEHHYSSVNKPLNL